MSVILAATGTTLLSRTIVPMTARQVTWFIDPEALLRHVADLHTLTVALYCQSCYQKGFPEDVTAVFHPTTRVWEVRCACAEYPPLIDRGRYGLSTTKTAADGTVETIPLRSVDELLFRLGWSFRCTAECARLGMHDGVQGQNDPNGHALKVTCGCTERIYVDAAGRPS